MTTDIDLMEKEADELWKATYEKKNEKTLEKEALDMEPEDEKKPEEKPKEEPKPEEKPKEPEKKPEEDFKQKYEVLKGKYDAEVPRMSFELAETTKKLTELEQKVSEIPRPEPKKEEPKPLSPVVENFKKEYPDIFEGVQELMQTMTQEAQGKLVDKIKKEVSDEVTPVRETVEKSDLDRFRDKLRADPDVGKEIDLINQDPKFTEWLQEIDPYSGLPKVALIKDAWGKKDDTRTLNFFKNFKKEKMVSTPKEEKPVVEDVKPARKVKEPDIAPPRANSGTPKTDEKGGPTIEDYKKFLHERATTPKWDGKEAEADAEERRLHAAVFKKKSKT